MIISEKQIMLLIMLLQDALQFGLSSFGKSEAKDLINTIFMQQSEELKVIDNKDKL